MRTGTYAGARAAFDAALAQDSITELSQETNGIHVMTIHRSKAKQFDGVIVLRRGVPAANRQWRSSFVWRDDAAPYQRSRKILRVAITRAKNMFLFLTRLTPTVRCSGVIICNWFTASVGRSGASFPAP